MLNEQSASIKHKRTDVCVSVCAFTIVSADKIDSIWRGLLKTIKWGLSNSWAACIRVHVTRSYLVWRVICVHQSVENTFSVHLFCWFSCAGAAICQNVPLWRLRLICSFLLFFLWATSGGQLNGTNEQYPKCNNSLWNKAVHLASADVILCAQCDKMIQRCSPHSCACTSNFRDGLTTQYPTTTAIN